MRNEKFIEGGKKIFRGSKKCGGCAKKKVIIKNFENMAKKGELRAEKQQVHHMACHARVRSMYIPGRRIDS